MERLLEYTYHRFHEKPTASITFLSDWIVPLRRLLFLYFHPVRMNLRIPCGTPCPSINVIRRRNYYLILFDYITYIYILAEYCCGQTGGQDSISATYMRMIPYAASLRVVDALFQTVIYISIICFNLVDLTID